MLKLIAKLIFGLIRLIFRDKTDLEGFLKSWPLAEIPSFQPGKAIS
jgi:hypothetical protein